MGKVTAVRSALDTGGTSELIRLSRKWLASKIYPGTLPQPTRPASAPKKLPSPLKATVNRPSATSVNHADALAWFESRRPIYDRLSKAVAPYVDRDGVIFDIGANIGYFTKILAGATDFHGTVHLFEPIPNLAELCRITLLDAPFEKHVHEFGLSDEGASVDIFVAASGNLGWNTIVAEKAATGMKALQIQVRTFESAGIGVTPTFIKIDVEGAEYKVLRGMLAALERWSPRPVILCEIGWGQGHPAWEQELDVFRSLEMLGYRVHDLDHRPMIIADLKSTTDVIFVPQEVLQQHDDVREAKQPVMQMADTSGTP
jgi:FkbM family methyltransferase